MKETGEKEIQFDMDDTGAMKIFVDVQKSEEGGIEFGMSVQNVKANECYAVATADYDDEPNIEWALTSMRECAMER